MMEKILRILAIMLLSAAAVGCVYDYEPEDEDIQGLEKPLVVIDGDIIAEGITHVKVGLTQSLVEEEAVVPLGAAVWVESEEGDIFSGIMIEEKMNEFEVDTRNLNLDGRYRLCVSIPGRGEYVSTFKKVLVSPAIDSITWSIAGDRSHARIEVSTHNDENSYLYCKWNYNENWESDAVYPAQLEYDANVKQMKKLEDKAVLTRQHCWSEAVSSGTYIANTEKLSENVIYKSIVKEISNTDSRVMKLYTINLVQKALDKEAYIYWENIKNNSSGTGGLFSPQPSEVRGNIVCETVPGEMVIGYISVSTAEQKRVFIDWTEENIYITECLEVLVPQVQVPDKPDAEPVFLWPQYYSQGYRPVRFNGEKRDEAYWALSKCTDCRVYSNSTRPAFWPK